MERADRPAERARLLGALYEVTRGSVRERFDPFEVAASIGLQPEAARAAVGFLEQENMVVKADGKQYALTSSGVLAVENPSSAEPVGGLSVSILNNYGRIKGSNIAGRDQQGTTEDDKATRPRALLVALVIGVVASLLAAAIWAFVTRDDSRDGRTTSGTTSTPNTAASGATVRCGDVQCVALTVVETVANGRDEGVYVRACFGPESCPRRALAAQGSTVYGQCRVEGGLSVEGVATWVRTPWRFVPGSVAGDGSAIGFETGRSDPDSPEFGYVTARHLSPENAVRSLPLCR